MEMEMKDELGAFVQRLAAAAGRWNRRLNGWLNGRRMLKLRLDASRLPLMRIWRRDWLRLRLRLQS